MTGMLGECGSVVDSCMSESRDLEQSFNRHVSLI